MFRFYTGELNPPNIWLCKNGDYNQENDSIVGDRKNTLQGSGTNPLDPKLVKKHLYENTQL